MDYTYSYVCDILIFCTQSSSRDTTYWLQIHNNNRRREVVFVFSGVFTYIVFSEVCRIEFKEVGWRAKIKDDCCLLYSRIEKAACYSRYLNSQPWMILLSLRAEWYAVGLLCGVIVLLRLLVFIVYILVVVWQGQKTWLRNPFQIKSERASPTRSNLKFVFRNSEITNYKCCTEIRSSTYISLYIRTFMFMMYRKSSWYSVPLLYLVVLHTNYTQTSKQRTSRDSWSQA